MKVTKSCPVCQNEDCQPLLKRKVEYPGDNLHSNLLDINYVRNSILFDRVLHHREPFEVCFQICTNCGFIFFSPRPEESDMAVKYSLANELGDGKQREEFLYQGIASDDKRAEEIHKTVTAFSDEHNANIIDIGGARGLNLKYFLEDNNCYVIDYERHELLDGVQYLCEKTGDVPESLQAEVALYCHTLEHAVDPVQEILRIKNTLAPGGLLYIEVPFGCWHEYQRTRNFLTHINFFSEGSLYYLLDMCGLAIRYLKLKPTLSRMKYVPVIVSVAANSTPDNEKIDAYQVTRNQMEGRKYGLRARQALLTARLLKFKVFSAAYRQYRFRRRINRNREKDLLENGYESSG